MKHNKKSAAIFVMTAVMFASMASIASVSAEEINVSDSGIQTMAAPGTTADPQAEHTGYKYRWIDGVKYKRLWSYTYGKWIDPYWTPA